MHSPFGSRDECPVCRKAERGLRLALDAERLSLDRPLRRGAVYRFYWVWCVTFEEQSRNGAVYIRFEAIKFNDRSQAITFDAERCIHLGGFEFYRGRNFGSSAPFLRVPSTHVKSTTPDTALMKKWYQECAGAHTACREDSNYTPGRLITWQEDATRCRLILNHEIDGPVQYASFSHCWGPPPDPALPQDGRIVLIRDNLEVWRIRLPWATLAKSMQHAIQVASMVGFHYIWIDNLCIVQDSPEDWQQQSAAMSDVYKSAALNIAALEAAADEAGFLFAERDAYCEFGFTADFDSILGHAVGEVGLRLRSRQEECRLLGRSTIVWKDVHEPAQPLNSRAWVYQERTFARRMLGFRQNQMAWYCRQMERSESDSPNVSLRSSLHTHWTARSEYNYPRQIPKKLSVEASWETVIKEYSALKLTRQTDKLIAVSAIAKEIAVPGTRYYAGLWSSNLWAQLGWRTSNGLPAASPRAQVGDEMYVAPSWSWASIDCHCDYKYVSLNFRGPSTASQRHGEVLDIRTEHIGFEFGQVSSGRMRLRAYLNPAFQLMSTNYRKRKDVELELSVNMDEERVPDQGRDDTPDRGPLFKNQLSGDLMCFVFDTVGDADLDPSQYHLVRWMPLVQAVFLVLLRVEQPSGSCIPQSDSGLEVYTAHRHW